MSLLGRAIAAAVVAISEATVIGVVALKGPAVTTVALGAAAVVSVTSFVASGTTVVGTVAIVSAVGVFVRDLVAVQFVDETGNLVVLMVSAMNFYY